MQPIQTVERMHTMGVDILGPLPMSKGKYRYILVFCDYFTKFPICVPTKDIEAVTITRAMIDHVFLELGFPMKLVSDRGSQFISDIVQEVCRQLKIDKVQSTAYHPQTDGLVERCNHTLCIMLSMYCHDNQSDWVKYLKYVVHAY